MTTRELPILFTGPMVRAILQGRKSETRRLVKWPKSFGAAGPEDDQLDNLGDCITLVATDPEGKQHYVTNRHGGEGDVLWVRETFARSDFGKNGFLYRADGDLNVIGWSPAIHMPRKACRQLLRVVEYPDVERLQQITDAGAVAEGIVERSPGLYGLSEWEERDCMSSPRAAYLRLFQTINGLGPDENPFVWVNRFRPMS